MDLNEKLKILSSSAKYDVSCSSSGSERLNIDGIGNTEKSGICHSWAADGRCISLLKVLYTNYCKFDCAYCINRKSNNIKRTTFSPEELVNLTLSFYKRNYIEGLFLSSGIIKSANYTMEKMFIVVKKLREKNFNGYIHLKAIPGADKELIRKAGFYADRMSVNIELPTQKSLAVLAPDKSKENILKPMKYIGSNALVSISERKKFKTAPSFVPAGQSTQMIIGASPDSDKTIINLSEKLYKNFNLKRVYYSAFIKVNTDSKLPQKNASLLREHRLYQADWLLRYYKFSANEILDENEPFLNEKLDPKSMWAIRNFNLFPIEVNKAPYEMLIRVPGIGINSALKIIKTRKYENINFEILKKIRVVLKRAKYFITCNGKFQGYIFKDPKNLKNVLSSKNKSIPLFLKNIPERTY
ncbi:putative DNA modification/repair radical SAM protein [Tepiditoga spiralis]|uniref:Putative DNA modification/repair radical SAM protein n=1 Tax=Tepiditoga spiralis TaxID=2108365 RepID=A0A7G1G9D4_9BACT|nr:putative DNA modification/repair radical SAM protein [Tepiditoga spiralis]BBE31557.1 putative DNA modification/repair radical SAM protein [Tepiditoga spiralis]